jgi:hypothetical protein
VAPAWLLAAGCCWWLLLVAGGWNPTFYIPRPRAAAGGACLGHQDMIPASAPVHATLAQPVAGADALKDLRAQRAQESAENPVRFPEDLGLNFRA